MIGAIVVAAGRGERLGAGGPKALVPLAGRTLLDRCLETVGSLPDIGAVVVVAPPTHCEAVAGLHPGTVVVAGGATRAQSVAEGLAALPADCDLVLVHDSARALTPATVFERVIAALRAGAVGVVPVLPVPDTIKEVDEAGFVVSTPDRSRLRAVQTPQGFRRDALMAAQSGAEVTDEAGLLEAEGLPVATVAGDALAMKVTTGWDLRVAELVLAGA